MKRMLVLIVVILMPVIAFSKPDSVLSIRFNDGSRLYALKIDSSNSNLLYIIYDLDSSKSSVDVRHIKSISKIKYLKSYEKVLPEAMWETGTGIGLPAILNYSIGRSMNPFLVHLSGMYYVDAYGVQIDLGIILNMTKKYYHAISAIVGTTWFGDNPPPITAGSRANYTKIEYYGLAYTFNFSGFYVQIGPAYSYRRRVDERGPEWHNSNSEGIIPGFQIGWLFKL